MNVLFASYGNDSVALIQWAHETGLRDVTVAYSDTGWAADFWHERVLAAESWTATLGFRTARIQSEGMEALAKRKKAWPRGGGGKYQFCTAELKEKPALVWLDSVDPNKEATCLIGVRREESANRRTFPEWTEESGRHGGRSLWAPLVRYTEHERNTLIAKTPFSPLPHRSKECWPCVNARKAELKLMEDSRIERIACIEADLGVNSKGNSRVMFSPKRHGGAIGIRAVVQDARHGHDELFGTTCDGGWCGA